MLVMRRRAGESFMIGEEIEVEILEISATRVKLGVVAPPAVEIVRKEAHLTRAANLSAAMPVDAAAINQLLTRIPAAGSKEDRQDSDTAASACESALPAFTGKIP